MDKQKITNADLNKALLDFGYELTQKGSHSIYRHPNGKQNLVLPIAKPNERAMPTHVRIVETVLSTDGIVSVEDFRFYLENGKLPGDIIQKGDRLIWTAPGGIEIAVVAAAGEKDGMVVIKQKGAFSPCPVDQLRKVS